jgi:hypothetical protein
MPAIKGGVRSHIRVALAVDGLTKPPCRSYRPGGWPLKRFVSLAFENAPGDLSLKGKGTASPEYGREVEHVVFR